MAVLVVTSPPQTPSSNCSSPRRPPLPTRPTMAATSPLATLNSGTDSVKSSGLP